MGFNCGIVGLPNVGKSTIFNALTSAKAEAANYPFCTIEPNVGIVKVPDERLDNITALIEPKKTVPTSMEFVDIAGLIKGASKGEGLGNEFLGKIREVTAIVNVVRCFKDPDVVHVEGHVDPVRDVEIILTELMLADLQVVTKKVGNEERNVRNGDKLAAVKLHILKKVQKALEDGTPVRKLGLDNEELEQIRELQLLTAKKAIYVANIDEEGLKNLENDVHIKALREYAAAENSVMVPICGAIESEIAQMDSLADRKEFLDSMGIKEPGLNALIREGYKALNLNTYFTAGKQEVRAWTIPAGTLAPQAAGVIHSDFEKGFIRAEVYNYNDLMKYKSEAALKEKGLLKVEGKEYVVKDGDVLFFRFNV